MAQYEVRYQGKGDHPSLDAYWYRVRVSVDGRYLGAFLGVIDGRSVATLPAGTDAGEFDNRAVMATGEKIRDRVEHGELRSEWNIDLEELPLTVAEIHNVTRHRQSPYDHGDTVLEFDI